MENHFSKNKYNCLVNYDNIDDNYEDVLPGLRDSLLNLNKYDVNNNLECITDMNKNMLNNDVCVTVDLPNKVLNDCNMKNKSFFDF